MSVFASLNLTKVQNMNITENYPKAMTFFEFKCENMGVEFRHNGHIIPAVVAWMMITKGKEPRPKITQRDKPGWRNGILVSIEKYEEYLDKVYFR